MGFIQARLSRFVAKFAVLIELLGAGFSGGNRYYAGYRVVGVG